MRFNIFTTATTLIFMTTPSTQTLTTSFSPTKTIDPRNNPPIPPGTAFDVSTGGPQPPKIIGSLFTSIENPEPTTFPNSSLLTLTAFEDAKCKGNVQNVENVIWAMDNVIQGGANSFAISRPLSKSNNERLDFSSFVPGTAFANRLGTKGGNIGTGPGVTIGPCGHYLAAAGGDDSSGAYFEGMWEDLYFTSLVGTFDCFRLWRLEIDEERKVWAAP